MTFDLQISGFHYNLDISGLRLQPSIFSKSLLVCDSNMVISDVTSEFQFLE